MPGRLQRRCRTVRQWRRRAARWHPGTRREQNRIRMNHSRNDEAGRFFPRARPAWRRRTYGRRSGELLDAEPVRLAEAGYQVPLSRNRLISRTDSTQWPGSSEGERIVKDPAIFQKTHHAAGDRHIQNGRSPLHTEHGATDPIEPVHDLGKAHNDQCTFLERAASEL